MYIVDISRYYHESIRAVWVGIRSEDAAISSPIHCGFIWVDEYADQLKAVLDSVYKPSIIYVYDDCEVYKYLEKYSNDTSAV